MQLMKSKKGFQITDVPALAVTLGVIAIVLGLMASVLTQVRTTQTTNSVAYNITTGGINAVNSFSGWQSTWVVVIGASVIIGIVGAYLYFRPK